MKVFRNIYYLSLYFFYLLLSFNYKRLITKLKFKDFKHILAVNGYSIPNFKLITILANLNEFYFTSYYGDVTITSYGTKTRGNDLLFKLETEHKINSKTKILYSYGFLGTRTDELVKEDIFHYSPLEVVYKNKKYTLTINHLMDIYLTKELNRRIVSVSLALRRVIIDELYRGEIVSIRDFYNLNWHQNSNSNTNSKSNKKETDPNKVRFIKLTKTLKQRKEQIDNMDTNSSDYSNLVNEYNTGVRQWKKMKEKYNF